MEVARSGRSQADSNAAEMEQRGRQRPETPGASGRPGGAWASGIRCLGVTVEHREQSGRAHGGAAPSGTFTPSATTAPSTMTEAAIPNGDEGHCDAVEASPPAAAITSTRSPAPATRAAAGAATGK